MCIEPSLFRHRADGNTERWLASHTGTVVAVTHDSDTVASMKLNSWMSESSHVGGGGEGGVVVTGLSVDPPEKTRSS